MTGLKAVLFGGVALAMLVGAPKLGRVSTPEPNRIEISYAAEDHPEHAELRKILMEHRILEQVRDFLGMLVLPEKIKIEFDDCEGEADAWYESTTKTVTLCYEYIEDLRTKAPKTTTEDGVTPEDAVVGPVIEVVLHEMGHAVFDVLQIPVLGREEDAADQFAAIMLLQMNTETARRVIAATAHMYWREAEESAPDDSDFAGAHSPAIQRFYQLVCIAYGHDETTFGYVREKYLDPERADECPDETQTIKTAFWKLLGPHIDAQAKQQLELANWVPVAHKLLRNTPSQAAARAATGAVGKK